MSLNESRCTVEKSEKMVYEKPKTEVVKIEIIDVISTSNPEGNKTPTGFWMGID